jgi:catechol 2,3-dioxygenase-like lactoylglutathione lyase family enzyme
MHTHRVIPILNVSDLEASFEWFAKLGWAKGWDWYGPGQQRASFGAVVSGGHEIFVCLDGQGGRGQHGVWLSIFVDDVDEIHARCVREGVEVTSGPEDKPWGVREMHVRHPDGHTFRIGSGLEHEHDHEHDHEHPHPHPH